MFGLFSRARLTERQATLLLLCLMEAHLQGYMKSPRAIDEAQRAQCISLWLRSNGLKAGLMFRTRAVAVSNVLFGQLMARLADDDIPVAHAREQIAAACANPDAPMNDQVAAIHALCHAFACANKMV